MTKDEGNLLLANVIVDSVVEQNGKACPCGSMYMAMLTSFPNMSSNTFNMLCDYAVRTGKVKRVNHAMYAVTENLNEVARRELDKAGL